MRRGSRHRVAALPDEDHGLLGADHAGAGGGGDLTHAVPGADADRTDALRGVRERPRAAPPARPRRCSGCATAVSGWCRRRSSVPCATRSMPATVPTASSAGPPPRAARARARGSPGSGSPVRVRRLQALLWPSVRSGRRRAAPGRTSCAAVRRSLRVAPRGPAAGAPVGRRRAAAYGRGMDVRRAEDRYLDQRGLAAVAALVLLRARTTTRPTPGSACCWSTTTTGSRREPGSTRTPTGTWRS